MAAKVFETVFPKNNEFIIFTDAKKLIYEQPKNLQVYSSISLLSASSIRKLIKADIVIFHSMSNENLRILKALPKTTKTIWFGWGYDYYDLVHENLLKEKTASLNLYQQESLTFKNYVKSLIKKIIYPGISKKKIINKINIFSPPLYEDYELIRKAIPHFKPRYASWNYGTLEDDLVRGFKGKTINGNNILLGNSASDTNNHLDAFHDIKNLYLANRKIIVPLSYGDITYRDIIIEKGKKLFPDAFQPLTDFISIDNYIAILQTCSVVVMNHLRQQALGNIISALYMGAKVFLDMRNPVYKFFSKHEVFIYTLGQLEAEYQEKLTYEQITQNRKILKKYWSRDVIFKKTKQLIEKARDC